MKDKSQDEMSYKKEIVHQARAPNDTNLPSELQSELGQHWSLPQKKRKLKRQNYRE